MTDRELVEYLDEGVCWHEERQRGDSIHIPIETYCIKCNEVLLREGVDTSILDKRNPTPTLEWMLERLGKKLGQGSDVKFIYNSTFRPSYSVNVNNCGHFRDSVYGLGDNYTLALRGAVGKMMESEK